jgi:glyoxylase-like metal-dependent hydrolase (beta-lactamase superfamily II)
VENVVKINRTTVFEIGKNTFRIEMLGRVNCYLLYGTERGVLIDCGFGLEPVKPLIDKLCPVPYDVCITHADGDHIGAYNEWDKVWLHPADNALAHDLEHVNFQRFTGFHTTLNPMLIPEKGEDPSDFYSMDDITPVVLTEDDIPELLPLSDGQKFDLGGGRVVTVINIPGHTMGSTLYLDPETRILFSGDAISAASDIKLVTATAGYHNMQRLLDEFGDRFDRVYPAHTGLGPGATGMNYSLPKSIIEDYRDICKHIVIGDIEIKEHRQGGHNPDFAQDRPKEKERIIPGFSVKENPDQKQAQGVEEIAHPYGSMLHFNFRPEQIIAEGETPIV